MYLPLPRLHKFKHGLDDVISAYPILSEGGLARNAARGPHLIKCLLTDDFVPVALVIPRGDCVAALSLVSRQRLTCL